MKTFSLYRVFYKNRGGGGGFAAYVGRTTQPLQARLRGHFFGSRAEAESYKETNGWKIIGKSIRGTIYDMCPKCQKKLKKAQGQK